MAKVYEKDLPIKEYHADRSFIGSTGFKLGRSMLKFNEWLAGKEMADTKDLKFGRIYHKVLSEESKFSEEYQIMDYSLRPNPDMTMGAKANKEWEAILKLSAENRGVEICSVDEFEKAKAMKEVLRKYVRVNSYGNEYCVLDNLLEVGTVEKSYFCEDYLGLKVKCRPDVCTPYMIVDFKSVQSIDPSDLDRYIAKFGWDIQIALYSDLKAMYENGLTEPPDEIMMPFFFMAQEKKEPYDFCVYDVSGYYSIGKIKLLTIIDRIKSGEKRGSWSSIPEDQFGIALNPSPWVLKAVGLSGDGDSKSGTVGFDDDFDEDDLIEEA